MWEQVWNHLTVFSFLQHLLNHYTHNSICSIIPHTFICQSLCLYHSLYRIILAVYQRRDPNTSCMSMDLFDQLFSLKYSLITYRKPAFPDKQIGSQTHTDTYSTVQTNTGAKPHMHTWADSKVLSTNWDCTREEVKDDHVWKYLWCLGRRHTLQNERDANTLQRHLECVVHALSFVVYKDDITEILW